MYEVDRGAVRRYRKKAGYTLEMASRAIGGGSYNKMWLLENSGTKHFRATDLRILADLFDRDINDFFTASH